MSKKDYIAIARTCARIHTVISNPDCTVTPLELFGEMVAVLVSTFTADNPRFDQERFFAAIYKEPYVRNTL